MIGNKRLVDCKKDKEIKIVYVFFNIVIFVYWYLCDI